MPLSIARWDARRARYVAGLLAGIGLFLGAAALPVSLLGGRPSGPGPGRLVAEGSSLSWRSPDEGTARRPLIGEAQVRFQIENLGGRPVRILEVESSCGCAVPKVEPGTILPGERGFVEVHADPPATSDRDVLVVLKTDSPLTPHVELRLRVHGTRRPPFLLKAGGDLSFLGDFSSGEVRKLYAITVEPERSDAGLPIIESDVEFLRFGPPEMVEQDRYMGDFIKRRYEFEVGFAADPPRGHFLGEVLVVDPWDPRHPQRIPIRTQPLPPIRVIPARILLPSGAPNDAGPGSRFMVPTTDPAPDLSVEVEHEGESPLIVRRLDAAQADRVTSYAVGIEPGSAGPGEFNIIVRRPSSPDERIILPVLVRGEEAQWGSTKRTSGTPGGAGSPWSSCWS